VRISDSPETVQKNAPAAWPGRFGVSEASQSLRPQAFFDSFKPGKADWPFPVAF
jgi:hypothetical protein